MAEDITKFTNLKKLIEQVQNSDPYYKLNFNLSKQKLTGKKGWTPEEKQVLKNMRKLMSTEEFLGIKDIDKFDFSKYLDTTPKPAANGGTAPKAKPANRVITLDEMIENGTAPENKPAVNETKPTVNGTVPETKPTANETKPGFWTRMKSRWTPGIGQLPSTEDAGIKQAGRLKSTLNGINPFYGFTEAATRQGMYDKAIADAKKAGYRNGEIPKEVKDKILGIKDAEITTGAKIKHGLLSNLKSGAIGAAVGYITDALSPKDTGADEMQNIYGGWGTTGKGLGYASYLTPGVAPYKIGFDVGDAALHKYYGENDEAGTGVVRDIVHLGSKWDELGNMLRRGADQYSNLLSGKGMRDDSATVRDDIRTLNQRAASYPSMPQDYIDNHRSANPTDFTSGVPSKPLNGIDYKRDVDTSKFISPYQESGNISKQQVQDGYLDLLDQLRRRGIRIDGKGFSGDFIRYLDNVAPEALGKLNYHKTDLTKSSYLFGKDGEQVYATPYMINKDAVQAFFNDPRVRASGKYSDAEISDILSKMNDDAIRYD